MVKIFSVNKCINYPRYINHSRGLKRRINLHFVSKRSSTRAFEKGRGYAWRAVITQQLWKEWESKNVSAGWSCLGISPRNTFQDILFEIRRRGVKGRRRSSWSKMQRRESYCASPRGMEGLLVASNAFIRILIQEFIPLARLFPFYSAARLFL